MVHLLMINPIDTVKLRFCPLYAPFNFLVKKGFM